MEGKLPKKTMLLKCDAVRTAPLPVRPGSSAPSLRDEYRVMKRLFYLAKRLHTPEMVAAPGTYFPHLFGGPCYSVKLLGDPRELSKLDFVKHQYESKHRSDSPEFWAEIFGIRPDMDAKTKMDTYKKVYERVTKALVQDGLVTPVPNHALTRQEGDSLSRFIQAFHQRGYVHGDLPGNVLEWTEAGQKHLGLIDPLGFRPLKHYGRNCPVKKDQEFQGLRKRDQDSITLFAKLH